MKKRGLRVTPRVFVFVFVFCLSNWVNGGTIYCDEEHWRRIWSDSENQEFNFRHIKLEMPIKHPEEGSGR